MTGSINLVDHNINNSAMLKFFSGSIHKLFSDSVPVCCLHRQLEEKKANQGLTLSLCVQAEADVLG